MVEYSRAQVADRSDVDAAYVDHLVELAILTPTREDHLSPGDVRRVLMVQALDGAGIPPEELAGAITRGELSLAFMDTASYKKFSALSGETFAELSGRTGVPLQLLMVVREAIGSAQPSPDDRVREDELAIVPFIELQLQHGFRPIAIERLLRVQGDSLRRMAETEADWWRSEVIVPAMEAGKSPGDIANIELADQIGPPSEQGIMSMYHAQQAHAWTANIIEGFEMMLAGAGLRSRLERPPAMCLLDITGYTRLTQERGDQAAAELAGKLARLVQRASVQRGGRPIKWLGDGVMFFFKDPGPGVLAALEMVEGVSRRGPPACPRRAARRPGALPGGRLLRADDEHRVAHRRVRASGRSARQR